MTDAGIKRLARLPRLESVDLAHTALTDAGLVHLEGHQSLFNGLARTTRNLLKQYRAMPELSGLLAHMGADALQGKKDVMRLPFTSPRTMFNTELDSRRCISVCDLPFNPVRKMAHEAGGSINDVLLAICGGALRRYLQSQDALPRKSSTRKISARRSAKRRASITGQASS